MSKKIWIGTLVASAFGALALVPLVAGAQGFGHGPRAAGGERPSFETLDADGDGDGALSLAEMSDNNAERMFGHLDADGDGVVSAEEFEQAQNRGMHGRRAGLSRHGGHGGGSHDDG